MYNKILKIFILLFLSFSDSKAQYALNVDFNYGDIDNNVCLKLEKTKGRNTFGLGARIHINPPIKPTESLFFRNGYADKFSNFVGLNLGYQRLLTPKKWRYVFSISAFNETFYSRMKTRDFQDSKLFIFQEANFIENYVGLSTKIKLTDGVSLNCKAGGGLLFVLGFERIVGVKRNTSQFAALLSVGVNVKI